MTFRLFVLGTLVSCLGISAAFRRRARLEGETIERRRETPALIAGRVLIALPLLASILAYVGRPALMSWASFAAPDALRWTGVALGLAAIPSVYWVLRSIGRNISETVLTKSDHQLVTSGPYRWIRHPLYTTGILLIGAIGLMAANLFILGLDAIVLVAVLVAIVPAEEKALITAFGDEYRAYMERTGRLLPRLSAR